MNYKWCVSGAVHTGQGERNMDYIAREDALVLLKRYNQDPFHLQHAFTVEAVMKWYANELGYAEDAEYWGIVGLLHDIDFEQYPDQHCIKSQEIMRERGIDQRIIHATASHGYAITVDIQPEHEMEKVLYAVDELTGLIGAVEKSFAIQAGREIRVMVVPEQVSDADMILLARDIAKQIEAELEYPGQIKVNVIRESRVMEYAK